MHKVVCFDFDDVLTDKGIQRKFMSVFGHTFSELELAFELLEDNKTPKKFFKTMKKVVELGKGIKYERVEKLADLIKPSKNAKQTLKDLKKRGYKVVIVSINDEGLIKRFLKKNDMDKYIDHIYAGKIGVKNGLMTGEISGDVIKTEKVGIVKRLKKVYGVKKDNIIYIGDGLTDLPIMKKVGRGILFCPNEITSAEVFTDKILKKMEEENRLFLVEEKDLYRIMDFVS